MVGVLLLVSGCSTAPEPASAGSVRLTIGVGFEDLSSDARLDELADRLDQVGTGGVTIAIGRPDWVAFPWDDHPEAQARGMDGEDRVARALDVLGSNRSGTPRETTLVIDVLAPSLLKKHPAEAAVDAEGNRSDLFPGASGYAEGAVGRRIVELCEASAARYRPDRIALTELILDQSFSVADKRLFTKMTGESDWPRDDDGEIDTDDPSLSTFRSEVAADLVERCATAAGAHRVTVDVDVRAPWGDPTGDRAESGHDYELLLTRAGHLTVWNYYALNDRTPESSRDLTAGLRTSLGADAMARITMSVGLWADGDGDVAVGEDAERHRVISPADLAAGVTVSATNGITTVSVTPASRMTEEHWAALAELGFAY